METREHIEAGNMTRVYYDKSLTDQYRNPYLSGGENEFEYESAKETQAHSKSTSVLAENPLLICMMHRDENGIPAPINGLKLTAGEIVAFAGDYFTKSGWGNGLWLPPGIRDLSNSELIRELVNEPVDMSDNSIEKPLFLEGYNDLANKMVSDELINSINQIEETHYSRSDAINQIIQQLVYMKKVPHYKDSLENNEAHFAPYSVRAYMVAHTNALQSARVAYQLRHMALTDFIPEQDKEPQLIKILDEINANHFECFDNEGNPLVNKNDILLELSHRYHAMAVAEESFGMHFLSDHFAAGHLSRINTLRKILPERFGTWGSILVNDAHNEDNIHGVAVSNLLNQSGEFTMSHEAWIAYGDGTFDREENGNNFDNLCNCLTSSMSQINRVMETGEEIPNQKFAALNFVAFVNESVPQRQPMFILGRDDVVYYRRDTSKMKILSPEEYTATKNKPLENGYAQLTKMKAFWLTVKLRVLAKIPFVKRYFKPKMHVPDRYTPNVDEQNPAVNMTKGSANTEGRTTYAQVLAHQDIGDSIQLDNSVECDDFEDSYDTAANFDDGAGCGASLNPNACDNSEGKEEQTASPLAFRGQL